MPGSGAGSETRRGQLVSGSVDRAAAWDDLAAPGSAEGSVLADTAGLPGPAQRLLTRSLGPGVPLPPAVILDMEGEIKLRSWTRFRARQVLRPGHGFVWNATAGKGPVIFKGGDAYWRGEGSLDFRLWGLLPVVRASGPDVARSARGRLAAETVAWAPQALTPQMGATWAAVDDAAATVSLPAGDERIDLTVTVGADDLVTEVVTRRWGNPGGGEFAAIPFGAAIDAHAEFGGITIATAGRVGWWWGTERQDEGEFFRFEITSARPITG